MGTFLSLLSLMFLTKLVRRVNAFRQRSFLVTATAILLLPAVPGTTLVAQAAAAVRASCATGPGRMPCHVKKKARAGSAERACCCEGIRNPGGAGCPTPVIPAVAAAEPALPGQQGEGLGLPASRQVAALLAGLAQGLALSPDYPPPRLDS